jgi:hypothetical protein
MISYGKAEAARLARHHADHKRAGHGFISAEPPYTLAGAISTFALSSYIDAQSPPM